MKSSISCSNDTLSGSSRAFFHYICGGTPFTISGEKIKFVLDFDSPLIIIQHMNSEQEKDRTPRRSVVDQYTRQAGKYARSSVHSDARNLADLVQFASLPAGVSVLDVATGTGFTAFAFAEAGHSVMGLDLTSAMLLQARKLAGERGLESIRFVLGRAEVLPFAESSLDAVTCRLSPHHFSDVPRFLAEVRRVLKKGGAVIITDTASPDDSPHMSEWFNRVEVIRDPSHNLNYSPVQWREIAEGAGLQVMNVDYSQRLSHSFSKWVETSGTPQERLEELRNGFTRAPDDVKSFFAIEEQGEEINFAWPVVRMKAVKP